MVNVCFNVLDHDLEDVFKISGLHGGDDEERRLVGCDAVWYL
jgi:hypothetical protein